MCSYINKSAIVNQKRGLANQILLSKASTLHILAFVQEEPNNIRYIWEKEINKEVINIFKLDIEGNELSALKGFTKALESMKIVQFEFGGTIIDARAFYILKL